MGEIERRRIEAVLAEAVLATEKEVHRESLDLSGGLAGGIAKIDRELIDAVLESLERSEGKNYGPQFALAMAWKTMMPFRRREELAYQDAGSAVKERAAAVVAKQLEPVAALLDIASPDGRRMTVATTTIATSADPWQAAALRNQALDRLVDSKFQRLLASVRVGLDRKAWPDQMRSTLQGPVRWSASALQAVVRTVFAEAHNHALLAIFREHEDILSSYRWLTSTVAAERPDNKPYNLSYPLTSNERPPAHIGSRSVIAPLFRSEVRLVGAKDLVAA